MTPRSLIFLLWMALFIPACAVSPAAAADAGESCPLFNRTYSAALVEQNATGVVGEEMLLRFTLDPPEPPPGFFVTVNARVVDPPEGASSKKLDILTGFPETSVTPHAPGRWTVEVVVSLMAKGSCGGLTSATALRDRVVLSVSTAE